MQKFSGKITNIMPVVERGEWKSVQFRVQELGVEKPESCTFTKSAKGENTKWVDSFATDNPVGSNIEVEYKFKAVVYNDKKTGEEKTFNEIMAYKTVNFNRSTPKTEPEKVKQEEFNKVADSNGLVQEPLPGEQIDDDLPL